MDENQLSRLERLLGNFERMELSEYLSYVMNRRKLFWSNFLIGLARGLGYAVGFALLGALVVVLLQHLVASNVPLIGDFLAEVVRFVRARV